MIAAIYNAQGKIISVIYGDLQTVQANAAENNFIECDQGVSGKTHYVVNGEIVPIPAAPSIGYDFDYDAQEMVFNIEKAKAEKWREIKSQREAEELSPFTWNDMTFDADRVSQSRIQGAAQLATISPEFEVEWTLADNTTTTLNKTDIYGVASALGQRVSLIHQYARSLREAINHATNESTLSDINWNL